MNAEKTVSVNANNTIANTRPEKSELKDPWFWRLLLRHNGHLLGILQQWIDISAVVSIYISFSLIERGAFLHKRQLFALFIILTMLVFYQWTGVYQKIALLTRIQIIGLITRSWLSVLGILLVPLFFFRERIHGDDLFFISWAFGALGIQIIHHLLLRNWIRSLRARGVSPRRAILVGHPHFSHKFSELLMRNEQFGIQPIGYVDVDNASKEGHHPSVLGNINDIDDLVREHKADIVYLTPSMHQTHQISEITGKIINQNVDVYWVPDLTSMPLINHGIREMSGQPLICLSDSPLEGIRWVVKVIEDYVLAFLALIFLTPVLVGVAIAIKVTSKGPIFFRQKRHGLDGKSFFIYKFRSMYTSEDQVKADSQQATKDDPRITPIGRFLRRSSIDELPQILNVLRGQMSMVGPRPHSVAMNVYYTDRIQNYMLRHRIKPGITGWAQVNGLRGETEAVSKMEARVKYDLYYINNWSLWLDIRIVLLTFFKVFDDPNAY